MSSAAAWPPDERVVGALYLTCGRSLYGAALRLLRSPEDAEDAVHDAFVALQRQATPIPEADLPAWLRRVVVNAALDRLRRGARWAFSDVAEDLPAPRTAEARPESIDLARAVQALPEGARVVFLLHDVEGFRHDEIAALLGVTDGTSKSQLARARALLRARLAPAARSAP